MKSSRFAAVLLCLSSVLSIFMWSRAESSHSDTIINANHYDAFWIWGDIRTAPYLYQAKTLYILQGDVAYKKQQQKIVIQPQGISIRQLPNQQIWLVFRNHDLNWSDEHYQVLIRRLESWRKQGNQVVGVQIDFDSKTQALYDYAVFLKKLRQHLPAHFKISITGLLDWTNMRDQNTLQLLKDNIDELVIQTYQGRHTVDNYSHYLKRISAMNLPFKIGLVQHGQWDQSLNFTTDPNFKGYVVFLLKD